MSILNTARASDLDFVLANQTARDFEAVYIASAEDKDWNGDLLKNGIALKPGAIVKVRFFGKETSAKWDLNIVDDAGLSVRFHNVNLAGVDRIIVVDAGGKITAIVIVE